MPCGHHPFAAEGCARARVCVRAHVSFVVVGTVVKVFPLTL